MKKRWIILASISAAALLIGGGVLAFVLFNKKASEPTPIKPQEFTISLNHTILQLKEGENATLEATTSEEATITWSSEDEEIARVTQEGVVTALKEGNTTVTASAKGKSASCTIEVSKDTPQFTIELNESRIDLKEGETFDLEATTSEPATVVWSSEDDEIASVDQTGHVIALKEGTTFIIATANNKSADCKVVVTKETPVDTPITLSWGTRTLADIDDLNNGEEKGPYELRLVTSSNSNDTFTGRFTVNLSSESNSEHKLIDYLFIRVYGTSVKENPLIDINSSTSSKNGFTDIEMTGSETKTLYVYIGMDEVAPYIFDELKDDIVFITFDWNPVQ